MGDERFGWFAEMLDLGEGDLVLEIGPGSGASLGELARRLVRGRVVGIDRSATAVDRAARRYAAAIESGRITVAHLDFRALDAGRVRADFDAPAGFDRILAVNVNLFWTTRASAELALIRALLAPGGSLLLGYGYGVVSEGPVPSADRLVEHLAAAGFGSEVRTRGALLAVRARPS
ncbi:SAM-dependent methyltransferase [Nocardia farcinica]|uniref:SAM-dependent methyltransferase n=1 Tax=Nocardia farcinica TaxID=37329 RepID=UPI00189463D5|nr:class I SAM-dependent methyltransferase [Nocardia farcinica]MBF6387154.1 class I SAM-dependent methyltransferase [Nocardia farcinica]MBF6539574.1 class I SAM-dependent methyltransferase [Nocardia farcinica]